MSTLAASLVSFVDLSIVVPAYNEELRLSPTLARLHRYLSTQPLRYEIIVVDDGSKDGTCALVEKTATEMPNLRLVRQTPNRGKGAAVRMGMLAARGQIRVMCDADGSMPPEQLPALLAPIIACKSAISIGSRYAPGAKTDVHQPRYRVLWSRLCNKVIQRSRPRRRASCSRSRASTAGRSTSRSSRSRAAAASASPRSASSGPTTAARA
jgi:glycosyltransferase involved in cell wall biosynthesis